MSQLDLRNPGGTLSYAYSGARRRTRTIYIENVRPEDIVWGANRMPPRFAAHPLDPPCRARSFDADQHGDSGGSAVVITYTTPEIRNANTENPEPEPMTAHQLLHQVGVREEIVEIPYATLTEVIDKDPVSGLQVKGLKWGWTLNRIIEPRPVYRVKWKLTSPSAATFREIFDQYNYIHQLPDGGNPQGLYRFLFADASAISTTEYEVAANWELDTGTRFLTALPGSYPPFTNDNPRLPGDLPYRPNSVPAVGFTRDPYMTLDIEAPKNNTEPLQPKLPIMLQKAKYVVEPSLLQSWQNLPQFPGF
ncbi:hypothetical protein LCGC14_0568900 [marine sediment metagenome]|uniref:Uncharacterized protein n=1 Tax=marine sediment metagenome TaxID=412755 RepID=A0A0F9RQ52_9ZZZZ|nr:hypothetical protein [Phycisphaerae bacterium]